MLLGGGLALWCPTGTGTADPGTAAVEVLAADLAVLGVPYRAVRAVRPPRWPHRRARPGTEVRVRQGPPLEALRCQAPLTVRLADRGPLVDSEFNLAVWGVDADGAEVPAGAVLGLAADWPAWHTWQAAAMGLACAECRTDLRPRAADDHRRAFRAPGSGLWPVRLLCRACRRLGGR
ncbi:hypothetical protein [Kitasatospora sp. NPDC088134]|uniref:hypothetical protein n=1 Tax=Kitasatospora sp. NPDC088134 TaxID=3364071 RepID=UPI0038273CC0